MNGSTSTHASRQTPIHHANGQSIGRHYGRPSAEHRTSLMSNGNGNGNGPPPGLAPRMTGAPRSRGSMSAGIGAAGNAPFEGSRSPPSTKSEDHKYTSNMITESLMSNLKADTSHVPCKFFRQGACQAGKACPFSHDLDATTVTTPCKYFAKGNCKFGAKCALAHILPDGRRVNRHNLSMGGPGGGGGGGGGGAPGGHLNLGGRVNPENYHHQSSALANSLASMATVPVSFGSISRGLGDRNTLPPPHSNHPLQQNFEAIPIIATNFSNPNPGPPYRSPRETEDRSRQSLVSPVPWGVSVLDAPLPASFDPDGVSWIARNGPVAASVPSKFGRATDSSPSHSFQDTPALRHLHDSAYGPIKPLPTEISDTASSPPQLPSPGSDFLNRQQRPLYSSRVLPKPRILSASLPRPTVPLSPNSNEGAVDDWDGNFAFEEDFLPNSLQELLTPQEKMRRLSRSAGDDVEGNSNNAVLAATRLSLLASTSSSPSALHTTTSPPMPSSPSRFGALFSRQKKGSTDAESSSFGASSFGHVGSPLRNTSLPVGLTNPGIVSPSLSLRRSTSGNRDLSPSGYASPPRRSLGGSISAGMISQQLQHTRIPSGSGESGLHPSSARQGGDRPAAVKVVGLHRSLSSSSSASGIGSGRHARIDEEGGNGLDPPGGDVFAME